MIQLTLSVQLLTEHPALLALVAIVVRILRAYQKSLTWPEYKVAHKFKRAVLPPLDGRFFLVSDKGGRDDEEYLKTVDAHYKEVVSSLRGAGGSLHLINSLKRRPDTHGDPLSVAHLVWTHADGKQTEIYLFANEDGTTDVYAHVETGVTDPLGHLTDTQYDGDVRGVLSGVSLGRPTTHQKNYCSTSLKLSVGRTYGNNIHQRRPVDAVRC